jgi:two-component sensor histidine kinase
VALADQRGTMFMELQHRISNNLQLVGALLQLEGMNVTDEHAKQALANASLRLTLIGKLHRRLHDRSGGSIDFGEFLQELCNDILESWGARNIECLVTSAILVLPPEARIPIALVATELVSNAIEHGFAGRHRGTINVGLQPDEKGAIVLTVVDDGNGLAPGFDDAAPKSLGLRIVRTLTQQLGGRFEIVNGKGVTCRLALP